MLLCAGSALRLLEGAAAQGWQPAMRSLASVLAQTKALSAAAERAPCEPSTSGRAWRPADVLWQHARHLSTSQPPAAEAAAGATKAKTSKKGPRKEGDAASAVAAGEAAGPTGAKGPGSGRSGPALTPALVGSGPTPQSAAAAAAMGLEYRPSRNYYLYKDVVCREMMLKLGLPRAHSQMPQIKSVTLTISAAQDTKLSQEVVPKQDLLLHLLAMEMVAGQPAHFSKSSNRSMGDKATGVSTTLTGRRALDFLEHLAHVVLPSQIGFEGATYPGAVAVQPEDMPKAQRLGLAKRPLPLHTCDLKVNNLMLYPDLEARFELFEALRSMQVRITVDRAVSPEAARMLLTGLALPVQTAETARALAAAAAAQEQASKVVSPRQAAANAAAEAAASGGPAAASGAAAPASSAQPAKAKAAPAPKKG